VAAGHNVTTDFAANALLAATIASMSRQAEVVIGLMTSPSASG
jgi:hypothetical protein